MTTSLQIDPETGKRTYNGYQLIRATPESDDHLDALRFIEKGKLYERCDLTSCLLPLGVNSTRISMPMLSNYQAVITDFPRHQPFLSLIRCVAMQFTYFQL